ncbi:MAG TPA: energy transducer TonB, partial [Myxococcota bacterium]|nr:energy transducer TonB [Myxococcota bacterium]
VSRGLRYPRDAEDDGVEGLAVVRLTIAADGLLVGAELIRSAGDPRLDDAALSRVRSVGRFPTPPGGLRAVDVPVRFRLP